MPDLVEAAPARHDQDNLTTAVDVLGSDRMIGSDVMDGMPTAHRDVDPADLSVQGLLRQCDHYREMYEANPEVGEAEATKAVQKAQEVTAMREQGMTAQQIKSKLFADNLLRAKERQIANNDQTQPETSSQHQEKTRPKVESVSVRISVEQQPYRPELILEEEERQEYSAKTEKGQDDTPGPNHKTKSSTIEVAAEDKTYKPSKPVVSEEHIVPKDLSSEVDPDTNVINVVAPQAKTEAVTMGEELSFDIPAEPVMSNEALVAYQLNEQPQLDLMEDEPIILAANYEFTVTEAEKPELLFDAETVETYVQLTALVDEEADQSHQPEDPKLQNFEAFIALELDNQEPLTLEAIQQQANIQPLEQTLVQVIKLLSEPEKEPVEVELQEIVQDIREVLADCFVEQENRETRLQITPELTEKLLKLLRVLGYEQPEEVLVGFAKEYSLELLLQAIEYICQLNSEGISREFLSATSAVYSNDDDSYGLHLGRLLLGLVTHTALWSPV